ncbi:hypothetical protein QBC37DRAFT_436347 [Rhypophila decipiens]|uniref:Zn(2)-C6 fungal-type domain-containing protein n=1 Tax=Rhypophila decipiens TaxID=261697 RepID=A0AAN6YLJ2_9PEZI|nr:hypothetical protein QBC37DRAFT_436347 [Rhypophila decipiens]
MSNSASSRNSTTPAPDSNQQAPDSPATGPQSSTRVRRKPIPRKGHTKSRRGCYNCKSRKVKCQENLPTCLNCNRIGLVCEYPEPTQVLIRRPVPASLPAPESSLQPVPAPNLFTVDDLRFFHHFVVTAYPPLPIKRDDIWREVAQISYGYDYLVHAMLGLAASHLSLYGQDYTSQALSHRVQAIQSLNKSLNKPCSSRAEGDARFGAIMALTFQASCMPEGMVEFLSMVRGCHIVAAHSMPSFEASAFESFTANGYTSSIRKLIAPGGFVETSDVALFDGFSLSVRALGPLCKSPLEIRFLANTERILKLTKTSVLESFALFTSLYDIISESSNDEFASFTEPTNYAAQLLLIHFILIEYLIGEAALGDVGVRFGFRRRVCIKWLNNLADSLPPEYQPYLKWPKKYCELLRHQKNPLVLRGTAALSSPAPSTSTIS